MSLNINIVKVVDQFLIERAKHNDRDYSYFHASEWDRCHRKIALAYYESKGFIKTDPEALKISPNMERLFDNGHKMHDRWKGYLESTGALKGWWLCKNFGAHPRKPMVYGIGEKLGIFRPEKCECGSNRFEYVEVGFSDPETWWGGHVDTIIDIRKWPGPVTGLPEGAKVADLPEDEVHMIVDYKSMSPFQFPSLSQPKPEHITQMNIYLYMSGLKIGKFIYEGKGDHKVKEYLVLRDDNLIAVKKAEAFRLKRLVNHVKENGKRVVPERGFESRTEEDCQRCKFRARCWGD